MDFLRTLLRTAAAAAVVLTLLPGCQPEVQVTPSTGPSVHLGRPDDTPKGILPYISLSTDDWMPVTSKEKYLLGSTVEKILLGFIFVQKTAWAKWFILERNYAMIFCVNSCSVYQKNFWEELL